MHLRAASRPFRSRAGRRLRVLALAAMLTVGGGVTLTACTTQGVVSPTTQSTAAKSLIVADTAFDSLVLATEQGVRAGKLTGAPAGQVREMLARAHAALVAAHDAYAAGKTADVAARLAAFDDVRAQALRLLPPQA